MVLASIGEHGIIFCKHKHFDFFHLRAASILKKLLVSTEQIKIFGEQQANKIQFASNEKAKSIDKVIEN